MRAEIARLIDYHEKLLGQPQRQFSDDDARALVGDYRMAHCLAATLSRWYNRRACDWDEVLQGIGNTGLSEAGIASPVQLRLALYDYVNEHHAGFLDAGMRKEALERFAASITSQGMIWNTCLRWTVMKRRCSCARATRAR